MNWNTTNPDKSGTYLGKVIIDGEVVIMEAEYHSGSWSVELYQLYDPHWDTVDVKCLGWTELPI